MNLESEVAKIIRSMDKKGKSVDEIDNKLVYDVGLSPEYSWKMMKKVLKLKKVVK